MTTISILRRANKSFVKATLIEGMQPADLHLVEREWTPHRPRLMQLLLNAKVPRSEWPQSLPWDWSRKAPQLQLLESACFGIVFEKRWQGLMMTKTAAHVSRLPSDLGKPLVYIDFLETAPWNWPIPALNVVGELGGIGPALFLQAVRQSDEEGFHGRVGLHALPQAEPFYERACGMTPLGRDQRKENLVYFELSRPQAEEILQNGGKP